MGMGWGWDGDGMGWLETLLICPLVDLPPLMVSPYRIELVLGRKG